MTAILVLTLFGIFLAWYAWDAHKWHRKVRELNPQEVPREFAADPDDPGPHLLQAGTRFKGQERYDAFERTMIRRGFFKLGDFRMTFPKPSGAATKVTRVMSHPEGSYILAFCFAKAWGLTLFLYEFESLFEDGTYLYSSNLRNRGFWQDRPSISVNPLGGWSFDRDMSSHERRLASMIEKKVVKYESMGQVLQNIEIQAGLPKR